MRIPTDAFQPHKWHLEVLRAFDNHTARFFDLVWHRRSRKTTLGINLLIRECGIHPKEVYGYIAPTYTQAKNIIWRDPNMLDRYLPNEIIKRRNESELYVEFNNGSILKIVGADRPESAKGMAFRGVICDEWSLIKRDMWEETLRPIISQRTDSWAIFSYTPKGYNHAFEYHKKCRDWPDWFTSVLKASESGLLPPDELEQAKKEMSRALFEQEFECSFVSREEKSIITSEMLEGLETVKILYQESVKLIACDPATGGDECVAKAFEGTKEIDSISIYSDDTMIIAGELVAFGYKHGINVYAIDSIGLGKGIADRLREQEKEVIYINSSEKAYDDKLFYNKRIEMWYYVSEMIRQKVVYPVKDEETKRQLIAPKYEIVDSNGKMRLEPKKYTKDVLGRSPDRADAYIYGIYALQFIQPKVKQVNKKPVYAPRPYSYRPSVYGRLVHA